MLGLVIPYVVGLFFWATISTVVFALSDKDGALWERQAHRTAARALMMAPIWPLPAGVFLARTLMAAYREAIAEDDGVPDGNSNAR